MRIFILLLVLAIVVQHTLYERAALTWGKNFYVAVYSVNVDNNQEVSTFIKSLTRDDFEPIADYFAKQGQRYGLGLRRPFEVRLGQEVRAFRLLRQRKVVCCR